MPPWTGENVVTTTHSRDAFYMLPFLKPDMTPFTSLLIWAADLSALSLQPQPLGQVL